MSIPGMTLESADHFSVDRLVALFNRSFIDYIVPLQLSVPMFQGMVERDSLDLEASLVACVSGEPAGLALVAVRSAAGGPRVRLAGMGVIPEVRGIGIGRRLLERVVDLAEAFRARELMLEVFESNTPARRLYETHGFAVRRPLYGYTLEKPAPSGDDATPVRLGEIDPGEAYQLFRACIAEEPVDALPPWQLEAPMLRGAQAPGLLLSVTVADATESAGYCAVVTAGRALHLLHLGILPASRAGGVGRSALHALFTRHPEATTLSIAPLVPAASSLGPFLEACGATKQQASQLEMALGPLTGRK